MSVKKLYFTPGPSALYFTVEDHLRAALRKQIPSISHRGKEFSRIYQETEERLQQLVNLPDDYSLFFTASATEIWERMLQSVVQKRTLHLVNGAFSGRFFHIAKQLGYDAVDWKVSPGEAVIIDPSMENQEPELIAVTHNETSTGVQQPIKDLNVLRKLFPSSLLTVDVVSSFPVVDLPLELIDSAYFSVQKCFGLPAGLGVWLVNQRFIERATQMAPTGRTSYHGVDSFYSNYQKYQTPATPNVLGIYLLGQVIGDMLDKGLERIRMESKYKSSILYHLMESKEDIKPFVTEKSWRSETVVVGNTGTSTQSLIHTLGEKGLIVGTGYGAYKTQHIRIANFPTHSKEQVEMLVDQLDVLVS